ncbi:MAG: hypothetical protein MJ237_03175 [bacterium]|nr:hypothetical protein [bacterium]
MFQINNCQTSNITFFGKNSRIVAPVDFRARQTNSLEKTQNMDTLTLAEVQHKKKKRIALLCTLALASITGILFAKNYKTHYVKKAQKTFQEVFLRKDISEEETVQMIERYKNIKKMKRKDSRENYTKALFEETKANFGFKDRPLKLTFEEGRGKEYGTMALDNSKLNITPNCPLNRMINTMTHEFRHAKQHELVINYSTESRLEALFLIMKQKNRNTEEFRKLLDIVGDEIIEKYPKENSDTILRKALEDTRITRYLENNFGKLSPDNIPKEYEEYTQKLIEARKKYKLPEEDFDAYWNNFTEQDARNAGQKISRLLWFIPI